MLSTNRTLTAKHLDPRHGVVRGIVLHDTAGSGTSNDVKYLANDPENRKISVDFVVTRDGTIWQLNPDPKNNFTNHAGRHTMFKGLLNKQVNAATVGIEIAQKADLSLMPMWPDSQVKAVAQLCKSLCVQFRLGPDDITTHAKIITDGSRSDPRKFPFPQFWALFNGDTETELTQQPQPAPGQPFDVVVRAGDTLWSLAHTFGTTVENLKALNRMNDSLTQIEVGQVLRLR